MHMVDIFLDWDEREIHFDPPLVILLSACLSDGKQETGWKEGSQRHQNKRFSNCSEWKGRKATPSVEGYTKMKTTAKGVKKNVVKVDRYALSLSDHKS